MQNIQTEDQSHIKNIVKNSASSFYWGMNILEYKKKRAMFAIYAFCRIVDDIADSNLSIRQKKKMLSQWKRNINLIYKNITSDKITRELSVAVNLFDLNKKDFFSIINGMNKDTDKKIIYPSLRELEGYCDEVAGAVGCLSVSVFEIPNQKIARDYAINLGRALQFTNILRDLWEDCERGRCYINREIILSEKLQDLKPVELLGSTRFSFVFQKFLKQTLMYYKKVETLGKNIDKKKILAAEIMKSIYFEILKKINISVIKNKKKVKVGVYKKFFLILKEILR